MRKIGQLSTTAAAERFQRYLNQRGVQSRIDAAAGEWEVWIYEEAQVEESRRDLASFVVNPGNPQFDATAPVKTVAPPVPAPVQRKTRKRTTSPVGSQSLPITIAVTVMCCWLTFATNFGKKEQPLQELLIATPQSSGLNEALQTQPWRLITPIFLHFSPIHLGVNLYMFWMLGGTVERAQGSFRLFLLIAITGIASNLCQFFWRGPDFGGLSGVVYAVFGYIWLRAVVLPGDGYFMPRQLVNQMILWAVICVLAHEYMPVANAAHFGGLAAGAILGALPRLWRRS